MEMTNELQKVLDAINRIEEKEKYKFYAQMKNALRIYYLGLNNVFIVNRVLKNTDLSILELKNDEKHHVENAGWLLDQNYVNDVYMGVLKANLILDAWLVFKSNNKMVSFGDKDFLEWYEILVSSLNNDSIGTIEKETEIDGEKLKIEKDKKIDFITPEVVLSLVNEIVKVYKKAL